MNAKQILTSTPMACPSKRKRKFGYAPSMQDIKLPIQRLQSWTGREQKNLFRLHSDTKQCQNFVILKSVG
jgi:hypothetical protein